MQRHLMNHKGWYRLVPPEHECKYLEAAVESTMSIDDHGAWHCGDCAEKHVPGYHLQYRIFCVGNPDPESDVPFICGYVGEA